MIHKAYSRDPFAPHHAKVPLCWITYPTLVNLGPRPSMRSVWDDVTCSECLGLSRGDITMRQCPLCQEDAPFKVTDSRDAVCRICEFQAMEGRREWKGSVHRLNFGD